MNNKKKEFTIAADITYLLTQWHLWVIGILLVIQVIVFILSGQGTVNVPGLIGATSEGNLILNDFLTFAHDSSGMYMIIVGLIASYYFAPEYVRVGVTRKKAFKGVAIGAAGGVSSLIVLSALLALLQLGSVQLFGLPIETNFTLVHSIFELEESSGHFLFGSNIVAFITRWGLSLLTFWLSAFLSFAVGWMVGTAFYRFNIIIGILTIPLGFIIFMVNSTFWSSDISLFFSRTANTDMIFVNWLVSFAAMLFLITFTLWVIRQFTKRMAIKL